MSTLIMSEEVKNPQPEVEEQKVDAQATQEDTGIEGATESEDASSDLAAQLAAAQAKATENWEVALREKAEADNVRRRAERDVTNAHKYAIERFAEDLLPVLDSLDKGLELQVEGDQVDAMREGMSMTRDMLVKVLEKNGVERVEPLNQPFNPEFHEAMVMQESSEHEPNHVMAVFQPGYMLNGRLVRPARVVVSKGGSPSIDTTA
jgi:molecular chaperone GrpE